MMQFHFSTERPFDYSSYFSRAVTFLNHYKWIFSTNNTKFIRNGVLDSLPQEWADDMGGSTNDEFNRIPFGFVKDSWSPSFVEFLTKLSQLSVAYDQHEADPPKARKGISIKKCYEIENLASFICNLGATQKTDLLIDFGCGLGYLSQLIHERCGLSILGIEGNPELVRTAIKQQSDLYRLSTKAVQFVNHFITDDSFGTIRQEVIERFPCSQHVSIIGLHACADLSITAIRCFLECSWVNELIMMPCCYHKMKPTPVGSEQHFQNMPLSEELADALRNGMGDIICRSFLRLGCQQTAARWKDLTHEDHLRHGRIWFRRGLIDAILRENETVKVGKVKEIPEDTTVANLLQQYTLQDAYGNFAPWTDDHRTQLDALLRKYPDGHRLSEYIECLQTCMQSVCENLILLDRMCYLEQTCKLRGQNIRRNLIRLKNDGLSPRCFIFYATKV